jgi:glutamine synthetase
MIERDDPRRAEVIDRVLTDIAERGVKFVSLQFSNIMGNQKSFSVAANRIESILREGASFDGSSVTGYGRIEESDMVCVPDPSTYSPIPWRTGNLSTVRFICDIYHPNGSRYEGDPRYVLQRAVQHAADAGYDFFCAPENEFFILRQDENGQIIKSWTGRHGYFDWDPLDEVEVLRREIANLALEFGIDIEVMHHEVSDDQHEIDFKYGPPVDVADNAMTLRMITKTVAAKRNYIATFMPKPFYGVNGSGMHVHQSLWRNGQNMFWDDDDSNHLSVVAKKFIAGQLKYAREICAVLNSIPNSFKRLIPGYEAPVYIAWGFKNRSPLIRVPNFETPKAARCEIRSPDSAGNPYYQFAALLWAGIDGVLNIPEEEIPEPTDLNVYKMTPKELLKAHIVSLPEDLGQALQEYQKSDLMKKVFGQRLFNNYLYSHFEEWVEYRTHISDWEVVRYMKHY